MRDFYRTQSRIGRELLLAAGILLGSIVGMPFLIWVAGRLALGEYRNGGPFALLRDFVVGLVAGAPAFWIAAVGPYLLILFARMTWSAFRR